ncbi:MAG: hypothetical protein WCO66_02905 [Candidatus Absconditabacteria bacterium]
MMSVFGGGGGGGGGSSSVSILTVPTNTGKIILPSTTGTVVSKFSQEMNQAYIFAYTKKITTKINIETADMEGDLIREHLAKMISNYAINVLGKKPDPKAVCEFSDISNESNELQGYMQLSCQLGLMGRGIEEFDPRGNVTRAQFSTILSRLLYGETNEGGNPYYAKHMAALKQKGILKNTDPSLQELRGYVMLMLMRAKN